MKIEKIENENEEEKKEEEGWILIVPVSERGCHPPEKYKEIDDIVYKALQIHAEYVKQYLKVAVELREDANPDIIHEVLSKTKARKVLAFGHGWYNAITANNCQVWLSTHNIPEWVKEKIFIFVACLTGRELCPELVKSGAIAAYGFKEPAIVLALKDMQYCRFFYAPLIGILETAIAIENGIPLEEAYKKGIERWINEIHYWTHFYYKERIIIGNLAYQIPPAAAQILTLVMTHNMRAYVASLPATLHAPPLRATAKDILALIAGIGVTLTLIQVLQHPMLQKLATK